MDVEEFWRWFFGALMVAVVFAFLTIVIVHYQSAQRDAQVACAQAHSTWRDGACEVPR